jgi:hypothetical protein
VQFLVFLEQNGLGLRLGRLLLDERQLQRRVDLLVGVLEIEKIGNFLVAFGRHEHVRVFRGGTFVEKGLLALVVETVLVNDIIEKLTVLGVDRVVALLEIVL